MSVKILTLCTKQIIVHQCGISRRWWEKGSNLSWLIINHSELLPLSEFFMINDSMILLFISLSCMLMMWFNVPLLFKDFLLDIHPSWPDFFHPELKMPVKRFNVANPGGLKVFTFSRLTDINQDWIIYFVLVNIGYRGGYWLKGQHAHFCLNLKLVQKYIQYIHINNVLHTL